MGTTAPSDTSTMSSSGVQDSTPTGNEESTATEAPTPTPTAADDTTVRDTTVATSEAVDTTTEDDGGVFEFDCTELSETTLAFASPDQIPLECRPRQPRPDARTVYIVINKQGIDATRLFAKNVKVVVKDLMIMDISPKK